MWRLAICELCGLFMFHGGGNRGKLFRSHFWLRFWLPVLLVCSYIDAKKCIQNWNHFWLQISLCWAGSLAPCMMHEGANTFVETLYSFFACAYKQAEMIELLPANWTTDRLRYVCFWDARRTQGGYWNWSAILETFCEADCGVGIWCNGFGPLNASVAGICSFGSFVLRGLRNLGPKILKLVSGQVAVIFAFQWHVGRLLEVLAGCLWVWYFLAGPAVADALVCLSFRVAHFALAA